MTTLPLWVEEIPRPYTVPVQPAADPTSPDIRRACFALVAGSPDTRTADRAAIATARGRSTEDIQPVTGHDLSRAAYEHARDGWLQRAADEQFGGWIAQQYTTARNYWQQQRPDWTGDWPEVTP